MTKRQEILACINQLQLKVNRLVCLVPNYEHMLSLDEAREGYEAHCEIVRLTQKLMDLQGSAE